MKFLNLLTDELRRARIFYGLLMISVLLVQAFNIGNMIIRNRQTVREGHPVALYLTDFFDSSGLYPMVIGGAAFALILYAVFIWLREWYFQGNYMYRLLILPGNRAPIAFAKVATILLLMSGLLLLQLGIFYVTHWILQMVFQDNYLGLGVLLQIAQQFTISYILFPLHPLTALFNYGFGICFLLVLMNNCILIFSYKGHGLLKTIGLTLVYDVIMLALLIGFFLSIRNPLTTTEVTTMVIVFLVGYLIIHSGWMYWLMNYYSSI